jgi:CBS domain-containing protein
MNSTKDLAMAERQAAVVPGSVAEIMSSPVLTIECQDSIWDAWQLMFIAGYRHLAVTDHGVPVAIISDRAILSHVPNDQLQMSALRVGDIVSRMAFTKVLSNTSVVEAAQAMLEHAVDACVVIEDDRAILGIVTGADLIKWAARL